jgi:hypothetical protein
MRIGLLQKGQFPTERPTYFLRKSEAEDLVKRKEAVWVEPGRTVQRIAGPLRSPKQLGFAIFKWPGA